MFLYCSFLFKMHTNGHPPITPIPPGFSGMLATLWEASQKMSWQCLLAHMGHGFVLSMFTMALSRSQKRTCNETNFTFLIWEKLLLRICQKTEPELPEMLLGLDNWNECTFELQNWVQTNCKTGFKQAWPYLVNLNCVEQNSFVYKMWWHHLPLRVGEF